MMLYGMTNRDVTFQAGTRSITLPAATRVKLYAATDLPAYSRIRWWAHPITAGQIISPDLLAWAKGPGLGVTNADVNICWAVIRAHLINAATTYDGKERDRADRNPRAHYNPHALPQYLERVEDVIADMARGADPRAAIVRGFNGRLASAMFRIVEEPPLTREEAASGRFCYEPITRPPADKEA